MAKSNIWIDGTQAGATLKELKKTVGELNREINNLPRSSDKYNQKVKELRQANDALDQHKSKVKGIGGAFDGARQSLKGMLTHFAPLTLAVTGLATVASGVFSTFRSGVNTVIEFDTAITTLGTITGKTGSALTSLKDKVLEVSAETGKGATEIASAMELVGSAQPELLESADKLGLVTKQAVLLAQAGKITVPEAASALTKSMNQFGASAEDAALYTDILNNSQVQGTATIAQLAESMVKAGGTARAFKISFENTNALLQAFAKGGTVGSEAGTQLSGVLSKLSKVQNKDFNPAFTDATTVIDNLAKANLSYTELTALTDAEGAKWLSTLINQNDTVQKLTNNLHENGTAQDAASKNTNTIAGNWEKLTTNLQNYILGSNGVTSVSKKVSDGLAFIAKHIGTIITVVTKLITTFVAYKAAMAALALKERIQDQIKYNKAIKEGESVTGSAATGAKKFGTALKSIGFALGIQLALEFVAALYKIASGAAQAEENLRRMEKARADAEAGSNDKVDKRQEVLNEKLAEYTRLLNEGKIKQKEFLKLKEDAIELSKKESDSDIKAVKERKKNLAEDIKNLKELRKNWQEIRDTGASGEDTESWNKLNKALKDVSEKYKIIGDKSMLFDFIELGGNDLLQYDDAIGQLSANYQALRSKTEIYTNEQKQLNEASKDATSELKVFNTTNQMTAEQADKARKALEDQRKELDELIKKVNEYQRDANYEERLNSYEDGLNKELFILQENIDKKYATEIEAARQNSDEKTQIGQAYAREYARLLQISDKDYEEQAKLLKEKYAKEAKEKEYEIAKDANIKFLAQEVSLQDALVELKVQHAQLAYNAIDEKDKEGRKKALDNLTQALEEQLAHEKKRKLEGLMDQYSNDEIGQAELNARKLALDEEYLAKKEGLYAETAEKISKFDQAKFEQNAQLVLDYISAIGKIESNKEKKDEKRQKEQFSAEQQALQDKLSNNLITQQEYEAQKEELDKQQQAKTYALKKEYADKQKSAAKAEAIINGIVAVSKAFAQLGPIAGAIASIAIGAGTIAQVTQIENQSVDQFADGGYHNVIGKKDGLRYRAKNIGRHQGGMLPSTPSLVLASERGPEYFVPNNLMRDQRVANSVAIIEAIRTNQMFEGGYTGSVPNTGGVDITEALRANTAIMALLAQQIPNMKAVVDDKQAGNIVKTANGLRNYRG